VKGTLTALIFTISLFLVVQACPISSLANDSIRISRLGIEKGLSNNSVRCIYQDRNGFMWFGTYDGLNRYDGYEFKVFRNSLEDSNSLPHNFIYAIHEDADYNVWIGTGQGIAIYNSITSAFRRPWYIHYDNKWRARITGNVNAFDVDKQGNFYIGTNGTGLMVHKRGADAANQFAVLRDGKPTTGYNVTAIKIDKKNRVWLFIARLGLCLFDTNLQKIVPVNSQLQWASSLEVDAEDHVFIGTPNGVYKYSMADASLKLAYAETLNNVVSGNTTSLAIASDGNMWIGSRGGGVSVCDLAGHSIQQLIPGESRQSLSSEYVSAIYEDREGRKWLGMIKGGINIYSTGQSLFRTISREPFNRNSLINNFASTFLEDNNHQIWVGTDGGGLSIWNRATNQFTNYKHEPHGSGSLSHNQVSSIIKDHLGDIWIATFGGGINKFNRLAGTFTRYPCNNTSSGTENQNVWMLYEDRQHALWATTFGGSLYFFNRKYDRFDVYSHELNDILSIFQDRDNVLWVGNAHELIKIDRNNHQHIRYEIDKPVRAIYEDNAGRFWLGTEGGGLIMFDRRSGKPVRRYSVKDGLPSNSLLTILEDATGNLWMSTFNGLSQFTVAENRFKNYFQEDGLQSNQFLYGAALKLHSGELLFGGIRGFNIFRPANRPAKREAPVVLITDMRINNLPLSLKSDYVKETDKGKIRSIVIPFNEAVLSIDFAALEFSSPKKISYAYMLEGWDKDWNYSGKVRTANYSRLQEGKYVLRIKSTNAEGDWLGNEMALHVTVLPPWYRSWWSYALYSLMIVSAIVAYQRYRVYRARLKFEVALAKAHVSKEKAERERAEAEYKIQLAERQMERIKAGREQEINEKRLAFFTNISHEFRTPLGLIINPIKDLLQSADTRKKDQATLKLVYRNARRLLSLVDQLLLFRKAEAGADRLRIVKLDLCALCKEVFLAFDQQIKASNIQYEFKCAADTIEVYADREKLEIVFYNLISNAFKYTPAGGSITIAVTEGSGTANVQVKDTGYGIPKETGDKLFERFYQVSKKNIPVKSGFGIGLYLVKHFIDSVKGKIWYESSEEQGTTFFIELLKGREHFDDDLIVEDVVVEPTIFKELIEEKIMTGEAPVVSSAIQHPDSVPGESRSVLIVDDDAGTRDYLAELFSPAFTVYRAGNAIDGIKQAGQYVPDIIISDVNMEGMNGIEFCTTMKDDASLSHIPIILLTGSEAQETKLEGLEGGADDYITKPFDKDLLMARVLNILKSRTTLQKYFFNEVTLGKTNYKVAPEYKGFLDSCIAIVEEHIDNPEFGIKMLAAELRMGQSNLYKKVKSISGQSPSAFIRLIRLRKVAKMLIDTNYNINEAAALAGFNDMKHFREQFTRLFGMKPSDYVKTFRKGGKGRTPDADEEL
jgi:signal transduction histidine kinase/ligand-binding sensor domain-containing protein/CheY-like chemotaxis protein/AraC-like DNA-binding protein